ncbi:MAG TPA: sigma-70 family RNA polymerase sigma factor, partial [Demequinaceae bacterium]
MVQDALVKVFSRLRPLPNVAAADQYVRRAMLTLYLDRTRRVTMWRRLRGTLATDDAVAGPEDAAAAGTDVRAALAGLSPRERTCVVLRHFDDLSTRQVAEATGLAEGTVKRYLSDALAKHEGAGERPERHLELHRLSGLQRRRQGVRGHVHLRVA